MNITSDTTVVVVGLGYVGLPLAVEFGKKYRTIGYDLSAVKIAHFRNGHDPMGEIDAAAFATAVHLSFSVDPRCLAEADFIVVAVPTPVDEAHIPDFSPLKDASVAVGGHLKRGAVVVYESTVYPGATEEICIPILEQQSGLRWGEDFFVGYSPERINPGDHVRTLTQVVKVVSADNAETLGLLEALYGSIIPAGTLRASSIRVAEASKVIENTQRDLNIALMNELAILFDRIGIDTLEVLETAETKWNFLPFRPGLVGGHCIGVDPYYLTHKAEMLGYHPQVILAGRRINDHMGSFVARRTLQEILGTGRDIRGAKVNVLGMTFKENCPDLRNTKVMDVIQELSEFTCEVAVHDPIADPEAAQEDFDIRLTPWEDLIEAEALVVAVAHQEYRSMPLGRLLGKLKRGGVLIDVKSIFNAQEIEARGYRVWRL